MIKRFVVVNNQSHLVGEMIKTNQIWKVPGGYVLVDGSTRSGDIVVTGSYRGRVHPDCFINFRLIGSSDE